ncbi:MAG: tetratricopeptide repeat protein [Pseudomonadota bacterium]
MVLRLLCLCFAMSLSTGVLADERYETLLSDLAKSETAAEADALSGEIWEIWLTAPDEAAQSVLDAAMVSRMSQDFLGAIRHLNRLVDGWPEYAEGWNQRATLFFILGDYDASLADVAETLAREPRHFGALSGKAVILMRQGKVALAQLAVQEALKFHPHLNERALLDINPGEDL